ncbi:MAG: 50S ribosome-binding GTPase [Methanomicrobiales archaeon]|jgi:signal recognition particle receptor subunit beta|nr:50S ribosome-binding GTPase [Methanomicrobiales archaeon]
MGFGESITRVLNRLFYKKHVRIGIYGPPNAGKTTLATRIARDWGATSEGKISPIPHETRSAGKVENLEIIAGNGHSVTLDIVDTPGVATKVDYAEFMEYGIGKEEAIARAREATEGVAEAMHWLREDIDGVIYMMDAAEDPFMQVNIMMIGIIESRNLPVLIAANKIDLPDANPQHIKRAFPQHPVIPISCRDGTRIDELYDAIVQTFR